MERVFVEYVGEGAEVQNRFGTFRKIEGKEMDKDIAEKLVAQYPGFKIIKVESLAVKPKAQKGGK